MEAPQTSSRPSSSHEVGEKPCNTASAPIAKRSAMRTTTRTKRRLPACCRLSFSRRSLKSIAIFPSSGVHRLFAQRRHVRLPPRLD